MCKRIKIPRAGSIEWEVKMRTDPHFWKDELSRANLRLIDLAIKWSKAWRGKTGR